MITRDKQSRPATEIGITDFFRSTEFIISIRIDSYDEKNRRFRGVRINKHAKRSLFSKKRLLIFLNEGDIPANTLQEPNVLAIPPSGLGWQAENDPELAPQNSRLKK